MPRGIPASSARGCNAFKKLRPKAVKGNRKLAVLGLLMAVISVACQGQLAELLVDVVTQLRSTNDEVIEVPDPPRTFRNPFKHFASSLPAQTTGHSTARIDSCKNRQCHDFRSGDITRQSLTWTLPVRDTAVEWTEFCGASKTQCSCGKERVTRRVLVGAASGILLVNFRKKNPLAFLLK